MIGLKLYRSLTVLNDKDPVINQVALIKCPQVNCSSLTYQPNVVRYL